MFLQLGWSRRAVPKNQPVTGVADVYWSVKHSAAVSNITLLLLVGISVSFQFVELAALLPKRICNNKSHDTAAHLRMNWKNPDFKELEQRKYVLNKLYEI